MEGEIPAENGYNSCQGPRPGQNLHAGEKTSPDSAKPPVQTRPTNGTKNSPGHRFDSSFRPHKTRRLHRKDC